MENKLLYIGITHETATVSERTNYTLTPSQKQVLIVLLKTKLSIKGLTFINTCNRTEIYFESDTTSPYEVREVMIDYLEELHQTVLSRKVFLIFDRTIDTVNHLLHVANGLRSAVVGDKQIINQVKESYHEALQNGRQGSLLERAFQAVFRSHKYIATESLYRQGSTSTAYSSLKLIEDYYGQKEIEELNVLILGAGEIAEDILKYLPKFSFNTTSISNRTFEKADQLAQQYGIQTYDWSNIESGNFEGFDVVITAVSNRKNLIKTVQASNKRKMWIDLAMPSNVNENIANDYNKVYNIDEVTAQVNAINESQLKAIPIVKNILKDELNVYISWLKKDKVRVFLRSYKLHVIEVVNQTTPDEFKKNMTTKEFEKYTKTLTNRLLRRSAKTLHDLSSGELTHQQLHIMKQAFGI